MKKRVLALLLCGAMCISLVSCGSNGGGQTENSGGSQEVKVPLTSDELRSMYSDPSSYKGSYVELYGEVFGEIESDKDGVYFQMYADPENWSWNTIIELPDPGFQLESGQYVKVIGEVSGVFKGQNLLGGTVTAPAIKAENVEISNYIDAVSPTIATGLSTQPTIDQNGYSVTLEKVELADSESRIYISVANNGAANFSVYSFNMAVIQNGRQYEEQYNFNADYEELQTNIRPGVTTNGIISFPVLDAAPMQVIISGNSDDWTEDFDEYIFEVNFE